MQGSRAPCVKARVSGHCAAVPVGLPVTFMFSNVCEGKNISEMTEEGWVGGWWCVQYGASLLNAFGLGMLE